MKNGWKFSKGPPLADLGKAKLIKRLPMEHHHEFSFVLTTTLLEFPSFFESGGKHCSGLIFSFFFIKKKEQSKLIDNYGRTLCLGPGSQPHGTGSKSL